MEDAFGAEFGKDSRYVRKELDYLDWDACVCHFAVGDRDEAVSSPCAGDSKGVDDTPPSIRFEELVLFCCCVHCSKFVLVGCYQVYVMVGEDFGFMKSDAFWG